MTAMTQSSVRESDEPAEHDVPPVVPEIILPEGVVPEVPANERAVHDATQLMRPTTLEDLMSRAALLVRVDRKYFVPVETFREFAARVSADFVVLDIEGRRLFHYESVYFDTPDLAMYRAHIQGRRRRFKLRTRTYADSGLCMLEVKLKGPHAMTVKERMPHAPARRRGLDPAALAFAAGAVYDSYGLPLPECLGPVLTTSNLRATFASITDAARFTCDVNVTCRDVSGEVSQRDDHVLVETKAGSSGSLADRTLRDLGVRPAPISKYCIGVAVTHPEVASNAWHRTLRRYFNPPDAGHSLGLIRETA
jgi:hypothetical protein